MLNLIIRQDGNKYMCAESDFIDLVQSKVWWGNSPTEALNAYLFDRGKK